MKKTILYLLVYLPILAFGQVDKFTINGKVETLNKPTKIYLNCIKNGTQYLDSAITISGAFSFNGNVTEPIRARLILDHGQGLTNSSASDLLVFYLENSTIKIVSKDSVKNAHFEGSKLNSDYAVYLKKISVPLNLIKMINAENNSASDEERADVEYRNRMQARFKEADSSIKDLQILFIKENPNSFYSIVALSERMQKGMAFPQLDMLYKDLSPAIRQSTVGLKVAKTIEDMRSNQK